MQNLKKNTPFNPRLVAIHFCQQLCFQPKGDFATVPLPVLLDLEFKKYTPSSFFEQEKALCTTLIYTYLRYKGLLELGVADFVKKSHKLPYICQVTLCLGLLELVYLKHIAEHATLFEYSEIIKKSSAKRLAPMINGALRNIQRQKESLAEKLNQKFSLCCNDYFHSHSKKENEENNSLSNLLKLSALPAFFADSLSSTQTKEREFFANILHTPQASYRFKKKPTEQEQKLLSQLSFFPLKDYPLTYIASSQQAEKSSPSNKEGILKQEISPNSADNPPAHSERVGLKETKVSIEQELEKQGRCSRQGVASQVFAQNITRFFAEQKKEQDIKLWDACCGRGGKSTALLEAGIQVVLCSDPNEKRLTDCHNSLKRLDLYSLDPRSESLKSIDLHHHTKEEASLPILISGTLQEVCHKDIQNIDFNSILIDVPCSTSGTLARNPEVKFRISEASLQKIQEVQGEILQKAWEILPKHGYLIYATCSIFSHENEEQIQSFLQRQNKANLLENQYIIPRCLSSYAIGHDILYYAILQKQA